MQVRDLPRRAKDARNAVGPMHWLTRWEALIAEKGAVRRAKIEQIDGAAAVVQHDRMVPRGGAVIKHNVAFRQPAGDRISATAE